MQFDVYCVGVLTWMCGLVWLLGRFLFFGKVFGLWLINLVWLGWLLRFWTWLLDGVVDLRRVVLNFVCSI